MAALEALAGGQAPQESIVSSVRSSLGIRSQRREVPAQTPEASLDRHTSLGQRLRKIRRTTTAVATILFTLGLPAAAVAGCDPAKPSDSGVVQPGGPTDEQQQNILRSACLQSLDRPGEPELCFEEYPTAPPTTP